MRHPIIRCILVICVPLVIESGTLSRTAMADEKNQPTVVRDLMWVWGNAEMTRPGEHTVATFAEASPIERARLLGVPGVVMAGLGLPHDENEAERLTKDASDAQRLIWEIMADDDTTGQSGKFVYEKRIAGLRKLVDRHPRIQGLLLDDMSSVGIDKGFKPEHIRRVRELLPGTYRSVKIWGVVYTMNFNRRNMNEYIKEIDVINLWTWHAKDLVNLETNVAHVERLFPDKPIVLGLYLYDYGGGRMMPRDLQQQQCETALKLACAGRIRGIVFLTIKNDPDTVGWTANWINQVGSQKIEVSP